MKFTMTEPCPKCPFRTDIRPYLSADRKREIAASLTRHQQTFPCHQTTTFDDDGDATTTGREVHCAGALIMLEHMQQPNQLMRIFERLGGYDRAKLKMDAPVFTSVRAFIAKSEPRPRRERTRG